MTEVRNILCPVDFTPISVRNVRMGVEMCQRIGSKLILHHNLDVRPPGFMAVSWMWSEDHEAAEEQKAHEVPDQLEELFAEIPEGVEYEAKITRGPLEETLLFVARGLPADLIIMGTHGKSDKNHDSLTERIIIQAPCSVVTIGESYSPEAVFDTEPMRAPEAMRFLVPVDFSSQSKAVLDFAFEMAEAMPHRIDLLHVLKGGQGVEQDEREIEAVRERLEKLVPESVQSRVTIHAVLGDPVKRIRELAEEFDALCILMGAHGKGMLRRMLFGTTTLSILHGANCPVWFVPESMTH